MSSLGPKCSKPKGHDFDNQTEGYTVYYGRDRGEKDQKAEVFESVEQIATVDMWQEYEYLFKETDTKWYFRENGQKDWKELTAKDCEEN